MARSIVDILLLLALPASGKSEVRKFILGIPLEERVREFHIGETVELDDFPYVHFLRVVDDELLKLGQAPRFYRASNGGFLDGRDWGTLAELVSDDFLVLDDPAGHSPAFSPRELLARIDRARLAAGSTPVFERMEPKILQRLEDGLALEARALRDKLFDRPGMEMAGRTLVIEFARGGPRGAAMPLAPPYGYDFSLAHLHPKILERAAILYIWVTPGQSFEKNRARAIPGKEGDVILHAAPDEVMIRDYGCDDIDWLMEHSDLPGTVRVQGHGRVFHLPIACFDNRSDKTTFARASTDAWRAEDVHALRRGLAEPMAALWSAWEKVHAD